MNDTNDAVTKPYSWQLYVFLIGIGIVFLLGGFFILRNISSSNEISNDDVSETYLTATSSVAKAPEITFTLPGQYIIQPILNTIEVVNNENNVVSEISYQTHLELEEFDEQIQLYEGVERITEKEWRLPYETGTSSVIYTEALVVDGILFVKITL